MATAPAARTQALPLFDPTRELPVPPNPYAGQPVWPGSPATSTGTAQPGAGLHGEWVDEEPIDPLLGQIGVALFWITVGWWAFFLIRVLGYLTRHGLTDTILIRTIDLGAEETVLAAVLSVLAALLLLLGRGRAGRSPLGWASLVLAVVTVGVAVWRLLP
ncbi:hypothetical protein GCM10009868_02980 [Terrabacter aerolatus]|uniref:Uncharacterized protein n=1 Tax=Terrabacter aerolatus TaxID=422442 RepID=A0A512D5L4_9MICO|nr:hypothetical protein TAE01_35590 [Terrabacter aerolatus]